MFTRSKARGLCAACEHEPGCIYEADSDHIILQCEQFKMQFPAPADPLALSSPRSLSSNGHNSNKFAGLCMNCDNRETCTYPKPDGGVWRCEEYV